MDSQECLPYQSKTRCLTLGHGSGFLKVPVVSFFLLWLIPHNQRAALMPMGGMMVCAVVVVCAAEAHNVILQFSRESSYTRPSCWMSMIISQAVFVPTVGRSISSEYKLKLACLRRQQPKGCTLNCSPPVLLSSSFRHCRFPSLAVNLEQAHGCRHAVAAKNIRNCFTDLRQVIKGQSDDAGS